MSKSEFINNKNWHKINRGYFYQAAMYYLSDTKQPLRFVERNDGETFNVRKKLGDFSPVKIDGRNRAVEQNIIITVKPRQVIVISNNKLNYSKQYEYVQIVPIFGLSEANSQQGWYQELIKDNHPGFAYIPRGKFGIAADLTQVSTIHKSMLLSKQSAVAEDRMRFIESHLLELLDL